MRKYITLAALTLVASVTLAQETTTPKNEPRQERREQSIVWQDDLYHLKMVNQNTERLTDRWVFVVDSSHSTWQIAGRVVSAFRAVTGFPEDQLRFSLYTFNLRNFHAFRDWAWASPTEFTSASQFIRNNTGVNSYVNKALEEALRQPEEKLTVIIISDGGFSESFSSILRTIRENQAWRARQGYERAIICSVGIENMLSRNSRPPYPKDSNLTCQRRMQTIGRQNNGGFFYLQPKNSRVVISSLTPEEIARRNTKKEK
jgi:hypothetical protein